MNLHLANNRFSDVTAVAFAKALPENRCLQWIDMSGNSITREDAIDLSRALCLQVLQPHQHVIGVNGAAALAHALDQNSSLLRLPPFPQCLFETF
jgi:hypothetical protein